MKEDAAKTDLFSSPLQRTAILSLALGLITLALYNPAVHNKFVDWDDNIYVFENAHVQAGLNWNTVQWAFTTHEAANWHPLTWLSHALDWQLFHSNPAGHHYMSVLIHVVNVILLFLLLQGATGFTWRSLAVAAIFAVHPVNVESVAWVAERKNVLSMMFFLLAMLAYGAYVKRPAIRRYGLVALCFALGLMAKPQVITLPFVLLLWDYWPLRRLNFSFMNKGASENSSAAARSFSWLLLEKVPLFLLSAASALITMYAQRQGAAVRSVSEYTWYGRLSNSIVSYARYVGHAFWPLHLSPAYPHPGNGIPLWQVGAAGTFLLLATILVVFSRKRYLLAGWLWFVGVLVPMAGIIQVGDQAMADRYAYIPYIGLFWMVIWSVAETAENWRIAREWLIVPAAIVVLALTLAAHRQIGYWHDGENLWRYALSVTEGNFIAHSNLGRVLARDNRADEAIAEFSVAQQLHNYSPADVLRLGDYELRFGHMNEAAAILRKVLRSTQDPQLRQVAFTDLGVVDTKLGNLPEAKENFESALRLAPHNYSALMGIGLVAYRSGDFVQAAEYFSRSVASKGTDLGYVLLATALQHAGRISEASTAFAQAQTLSTDLAQTQEAAKSFLQ